VRGGGRSGGRLWQRLAVIAEALDRQQLGRLRQQRREEHQADFGVLGQRQQVERLVRGGADAETESSDLRIGADDHAQRTVVRPAGVGVVPAPWVQRGSAHAALVAAAVRVQRLQHGVVVRGRTGRLEIPVLAAVVFTVGDDRQVRHLMLPGRTRRYLLQATSAP
jgi:hypothetical protein